MKGKLIIFFFLFFNGFLACANDTIQARKLIEKADSFYNQKTPEGDSLALLYYNQAISAYHTYRVQNFLLARAYLYSAQIYTLQGQYKKAIPHYSSFIDFKRKKIDTPLIEAHRLLGEAFYFTFQYDSALMSLQYADSLTKKFSAYPKHSLIVNTIGLIYHTRGKYTEAISYFQRAAQLTDDPAILLPLYLNIGDAFRKQHKYDRAVKAFQQALAYAKNHPMECVIFNNIGRVYLEKNDYSTSLQYFDKAKAAAHKLTNRDLFFEAKLYNNFGAAYSGLKNYKAAHTAYDRALQLAGEGKSVTKARSFVGKAQVFEAMNELNKALAAYNRALDVLNLNGRTISELYQLTALTAKAKLLHRMKDFKGAFECYIPPCA